MLIKSYKSHSIFPTASGLSPIYNVRNLAGVYYTLFRNLLSFGVKYSIAVKALTTFFPFSC